MHLFVVVHGMWGSGADVAYIAEQIRALHGPSGCHVLVSAVNGGTNTYDGVDACGERLFDEVLAFVSSQTQAQVTRISFIGYSAGGLFTRYCVGLMHMRGFFDQVLPVSFVTLACPHLGVRRGRANAWNKMFNSVAAWAVYRSGAQLALADTHGAANDCLLLSMSRPDSVFVLGLRRFTRLVAFANVTADRTVPYHTASLRRHNTYAPPTQGFDLRTRLLEFPHVVASADAVKLLQLHSNAMQPNAEGGGGGQVALQEHEPSGNWVLGSLATGARLGIITCLLPVWLVVAPTVSAIIIRRKEAANVGQLKYQVTTLAAAPAAAAGQLGDAAAVDVAVQHSEAVAASGGDVQVAAAAARDIKSEILMGIGSLGWSRVDVCLPGPHTHGRIVVRRPWIDGSGRDVVKFLVEVALLP